MEKQLNLISVIRIILKWKKSILIVCAIALVGSIVISDPHIMKPYYASKSVILPSNPSITNSENMFEQKSQNFFGTSDDVDRLMAIAQSAQLKMFMVQRYNLFKHYDIDSATSDYPNYAVQLELEDNVNIERTDKGSIEITVYDQDKDTAAHMVNAMVWKIDDISKNLLMDNKQKMVSIYNNKISAKEATIKILTDSIIKLRNRYNLAGNISDLNRMNNMSAEEKASFDMANEEIKILDDKKKAALKELNNSIGLSEQFKATINRDVPSIFILEKGFPAEKKSKPVRWLVVFSCVFIAFVVMVLTALVSDYYKNIKGELNAPE